MKIPKAAVPQMAGEMLHSLLQHRDIETDNPNEVRMDLEAVMTQYIRDEQAITESARELVNRRGLPSSQIGRTKRQLAEQQKLKLGEDGIDYLVEQMIESLMHSHNVGEIYAADHRLRRKLREPLRRALDSESNMHGQVRQRMKHMKEGSASWEIEYQRILEDVRRRKGM